MYSKYELSFTSSHTQEKSDDHIKSKILSIWLNPTGLVGDSTELQ